MPYDAVLRPGAVTAKVPKSWDTVIAAGRYPSLCDPVSLFELPDFPNYFNVRKVNSLPSSAIALADLDDDEEPRVFACSGIVHVRSGVDSFGQIIPEIISYRGQTYTLDWAVPSDPTVIYED